MSTSVQCPECDKEVTLNDKGECPNCGLNVSRVLAHDRHERALEKMRKKRNPEKEPDSDSFLGGFFK